MASTWYSKVVKLFTLSDKQLVQLSLGISAAGAMMVMGMYGYQKYHNKNTEYTLESMRMLQGYPNLNDVLGVPVKLRGFQASNPFHRRTDKQIRIYLPVQGAVKPASVYSWCSLHDNTDTGKQQWRVDRLDLQTDVEGSLQQWTIFQHPECREDPDLVFQRAELSEKQEMNSIISSTPVLDSSSKSAFDEPKLNPKS
ncbi:uncharacterized protein LOC127847683 isoform X1 [Dreissena polymorpha]|nr:uncharacterized protein LOC127847683 isoform X1 [Dreissena polymorpha]